MENPEQQQRYKGGQGLVTLLYAKLLVVEAQSLDLEVEHNKSWNISS